MTDIRRLELHVVELATAFRVRLHFVPDMPYEGAQVVANSVIDPRVPSIVKTRPIHSEEEYAVALHELGHILHPSGYLRGKITATPLSNEEYRRHMNLILQEEDSAWVWAEANALYWSAAMEGLRRTALQCYDNLVRDALRSASRPNTPPAPPPSAPTRYRAVETLDDFLKRRDR